MNRDCHGDLYTFDGKRWYRCLLDSTVIENVDVEKACPRCGRAIVAEEHGDVSSRTVTTTEVFYDGAWYHHSEATCEAVHPEAIREG